MTAEANEVLWGGMYIIHCDLWRIHVEDNTSVLLQFLSDDNEKFLYSVPRVTFNGFSSVCIIHNKQYS